LYLSNYFQDERHRGGNITLQIEVIIKMDVTWNPEKEKKNINKRRLPLSLGGLVLDDIQRIERYDEEHSTPGVCRKTLL
jgi:hypothetical protein